MAKFPDINGSLWHVLIEEYYPKIIKVVYNIVRNKDLAEDIAQDTFAKAIDRFNQLKDPDRFYPWIISIAVNLAKKRVKQRQKEVIGLDVDWNNSEVINFNWPLELAIRNETQETILKSIKKLSLQEQKVIFFRYYMDMREKDIAQALDLSVGTVKSYLYRARLKLYRDLEESFN